MGSNGYHGSVHNAICLCVWYTVMWNAANGFGILDIFLRLCSVQQRQRRWVWTLCQNVNAQVNA